MDAMLISLLNLLQH